MLINKKNSSFNTLGTLRLSQPNLFEKVLFFVGLIKLFQGFIPVSVTHFVPVGWVKPLAAYPAKKSMTSYLNKPKPVKDIVLAVS